MHDLLRAIAVEVLGEEPEVTRPQGAPIVGMTRALLAQSADLVDDPERAGGWTPDGDRIKADALFLVDGPRHASDRATMNFGSRGLMAATITVYGRDTRSA